jgi:hypothetical protein
MLIPLIIAGLALLAATISILYIHRLQKKIKAIEFDRLSFVLLNARMEDLKKVTTSLSHIDKIIISSNLANLQYKGEVIDKTSRTYLSTAAIFEESHAFLPQPVAGMLTKEKTDIDNLIGYVKDSLTKEYMAKGAFDEMLSDLIQRQTRWVDSVEKHFHSQLNACVQQVHSSILV